jgi:ferredoxin
MQRRFQVTFTRSGKTIEVGEGERVLAAGLRAGVPLASDCRKGICKTCMARVEGLIDQEDAWQISDDELAQGFALLCVGRPRSDLRIEA